MFEMRNQSNVFPTNLNTIELLNNVLELCKV